MSPWIDTGSGCASLSHLQQSRLNSCQIEMRALGCDTLPIDSPFRNCMKEALSPLSLLKESEIRIESCVKGAIDVTIGSVLKFIKSAVSEAELQARYFSPEVYQACMKREESVEKSISEETSINDDDLEVLRNCKRRLVDDFPEFASLPSDILDNVSYAELRIVMQRQIRQIRELEPSLAKFMRDHPGNIFKSFAQEIEKQRQILGIKLACYEPAAQEILLCEIAVSVLGLATGLSKIPLRIAKPIEKFGKNQANYRIPAADKAESTSKVPSSGRLDFAPTVQKIVDEAKEKHGISTSINPKWNSNSQAVGDEIIIAPQTLFGGARESGGAVLHEITHITTDRGVTPNSTLSQISRSIGFYARKDRPVVPLNGYDAKFRADEYEARLRQVAFMETDDARQRGLKRTPEGEKPRKRIRTQSNYIKAREADIFRDSQKKILEDFSTRFDSVTISNPGNGGVSSVSVLLEDVRIMVNIPAESFKATGLSLREYVKTVLEDRLKYLRSKPNQSR